MNNYLMRSLMFVPGHNERLLESASRSMADVILLDLEDSVQPAENKQEAREMLRLAEEAKKEGKGVAVMNGKFIGPPMVLAAKNILKKKELIERRNHVL